MKGRNGLFVAGTLWHAIAVFMWITGDKQTAGFDLVAGSVFLVGGTLLEAMRPAAGEKGRGE